MTDKNEYGMGWVHDPVEVAKVLLELDTPLFGDTPAAEDSAIPEEVFLWKAAVKVLGAILPPRNQGQVGSCVSFGTCTAVEHTMLCEIAAGDSEEFKPLVQEAVYGGSRVEIGGGRMRGDGSCGSWAAKFVTQYGVLARSVYGTTDLTKYSESLCRQWGSSGVPAELESLAKAHPVQGTALVRNWDEAKKALANGYGISICSNRGFSMSRDGDGFASPRGQWNHCMGLVGYQSARPGGFILNSWGGSAHTGPSGRGEPSPAGFWAEDDVIDGMLRQGDSWAFSAVQGFPSNKIDWRI